MEVLHIERCAAILIIVLKSEVSASLSAMLNQLLSGTSQ